MFVIFFISALAETNRPPFDLPEAELRTRRRLHGRIFVDALLLFMLGEYANIDPDVRADDRCCSSAAGCRRSTVAPFTCDPGVDLVRRSR